MEPQLPSTEKLVEGFKAGGPLTAEQITGRDSLPTPITIETPNKTPTVQATPTLPTPTAPQIEQTFINSLTQNQATLRKQLEDTFKTQKADVDKQLEEAKIAQQGFLAKMDPTTRPTFGQETRVLQNQLDAAELASKTIQTNFEEKQRLVNELETILTEGNEFIKAQQGPGSNTLGVVSLRKNRAIQDVSARAGVIEAVLSARDGQIAQAHNIINQAKDTVQAQWNDNLDYYNTLLSYNEKEIIRLDKESKDIADKQVKIIVDDLKKVDDSVEYIKELMIDPKSAQFMADAGIKITDSIETINQKMAKQSQIEEVKDTIKDFTLKGYEHVFGQTAGTVPVQVGGKTLYFKSKTGGGSGFTPQEQRQLEQAGLLNASRQEQLDFLYGKGGDEYGTAEDFVSQNPNATDAELKAALLRDSNLSVTDINAILANRPNKVTLSDAQAKALLVDELESSFDEFRGFFKSRDTELKNTKEALKKEIELYDMSEGDREKLRTMLESIKVSDLKL